MRAKLSCVVVALLLVGADTSPSSDSGARIELSGSRWELVCGRNGNTEMEGATLTFLRDGRLELLWKVRAKKGTAFFLQYQYLFEYEREPRTGMPVFVYETPRSFRCEGTIRMVGHRLEWKSIARDPRRPQRDDRNGEMHLLLKRVK